MIILKEEGDDIVWKYGIPVMMNYQSHLISRIDCATQAKCANLKAHDQFEFALKGKLDWSKNVLEERDAPWQAVLASGDHVYCVHLSLALWLELYCESSPTAPLTPYLFAFSEDTAIPSVVVYRQKLLFRMSTMVPSSSVQSLKILDHWAATLFAKILFHRLSQERSQQTQKRWERALEVYDTCIRCLR